MALRPGTPQAHLWSAHRAFAHSAHLQPLMGMTAAFVAATVASAGPSVPPASVPPASVPPASAPAAGLRPRPGVAVSHVVYKMEQQWGYSVGEEGSQFFCVA